MRVELKSLIVVALIATSVVLFSQYQPSSLKVSKRVALSHEEGTSNLIVQKALYHKDMVLFEGKFVSLNSTDPNIQVSLFNYMELVNYFAYSGIDYVLKPKQNYLLKVYDISKLKNIEIQFLAADQSIYTAVITPEQYTLPADEYGEYTVLIIPQQTFGNTFPIGTAVFSGYKLEYDPETKTTYIQKK
ncbi:transmembrane protein, putative (macronuclear) [Tetrahymena thermophila SB210]|uniref:Transmembrane protein, putative n=1 Tax=Tetrahymena thermophila (strain SB210) TaxID=312017 RepID=Q240N0_TETTS|nr:transmembrane protein, putative [Tetrahymena thermophila SB210]EAS02235.1 transmembrane protein, putative [Tetrahymena thermophila SB210]|eukprot:XP_001022480.1 transmembrane protein, putative [Tetrahymena thermophila SB210]